MKRDCPTIQELLAFDAVARQQSITLAAGALCITASAVSKQIAGLEAFLGRELLEKNGRSVQLTPQGRAYWLKISAGLRDIETATFEARSGDASAGLLTLASVPTFLTKWLIPRLPAFTLKSRHVMLSFSRHLEPCDGIPAGVDAAIRYGPDGWPGVVSDYIAGQEFVLIGSRELVWERFRLAQPADISGHTLLHHEGTHTAWREWASQHGVAQEHVVAGPRFAQYSALIQAALSSLGIGLVPKLLVQDELAEGLLLSPCGAPVSLNQGHYLCYRPGRLALPGFAAFREWLMDEGKKSRGGET
jgi:LysR family transcriptional regulator, glycine cleavage system transcriptional activator